MKKQANRTDTQSPSCPSCPSHPERVLPPYGGYEQLLSFKKARVVFDATVCFCGRFVSRQSRTHDQMIQAARSGKQNIIEGSGASGTSKETEIKLTNVARASLEELLEDYRDFLRTNGAAEWEKDSKEALFVRKLGSRKSLTYEVFRESIETRPVPVVANIIISLIHQTNYLLDQQLRRLEQDFLREGGLRERMTRARLAARSRESRSRQ
ncbi:MAG TPA: four helix bundle suffix domain-containing protein [Clostridia bacterium]|nr:four helix bundle suffix domain-containing protein [Clostridia bacterium]